MNLLNNLAQNRFIYFFAFLFVLFSLTNLAIKLPERSTENDFTHYYLATKIFLDGKNPYKIDLAPLYSEYGFENKDIITKIISPYPPSFFVFFAPFAMLKPNQAFIGWVLLEALSLCTILWLTKILLINRLSNRAWFFFCVAIITSGWVYSNFHFSQVGLFLTAIILLGFALHRNASHTAACFVISIAGLLKIFPFILLPWFLIKGKTSIKDKIFRAIFLLVFFIIVINLTGSKNWLEFIDHSMNSVIADSINSANNYSLPSFIISIGYAFNNYSLSEFQNSLLNTIGMLIGLSLMGLCYFICFKTNDDSEAEFCLICLAMLTGNIRTFGHYFVFLIFPIAVAFVRSYYSTSIRILKIFIIYVMLILVDAGTHQFFDNLYLKILASYIPMYGLIGLIVFFYNEVKTISTGKNFICKKSSKPSSNYIANARV